MMHFKHSLKCFNKLRDREREDAKEDKEWKEVGVVVVGRGKRLKVKRLKVKRGRNEKVDKKTYHFTKKVIHQQKNTGRNDTCKIRQKLLKE